MGLKIHQEKIDAAAGEQLVSLCPFGAVSYDGTLSINSSCKLCKMCAREGPAGAITWEEEGPAAECDKAAWRGVAVFAEQRWGKVHPVSLELVGKAQQLAAVTGHPVYALLIGSQVRPAARELLEYGVDKVFVYDDPRLSDFLIGPYANAFTDFITHVHPSSILVGATSLGRSLAPKVAARMRAGLTADCTMLEMKENTDLVQIRPAFGGNIMAQIVTPNARPQFCTVRYKIFSTPQRTEVKGEVVEMQLEEAGFASRTEVLNVLRKPSHKDISDAEIIVAVGRGLKSRDDLELIRAFAEQIGAQLACTRPLIEAGWFDPRQQIGLSGRTVKPKVIVTVGISGAVQFTAGMNSSDLIIAINTDRSAPIFDVAHYGFVGDLYEILPRLLERIKEGIYV